MWFEKILDIIADKFYTLLFLCIGVLAFFWGFARLRTKRMIENVPTSTVRGMAMGLVELSGHALPLAPGKAAYFSPLTGTECAYYKYEVSRFVWRGKRSYWETIIQDDSSPFPFWLEDNTGRVMIQPKGAEIMLPLSYTYTSKMGKEMPGNIVNFINRFSVRHRGLFGKHLLLFQEWRIPAGDTVYVLGTAQKTRAKDVDPKEKLVERLRQLKNNADKMAAIDTNKDGEISPEEWDAAVANVEKEILEETLKEPLDPSVPDVVITTGEAESTFIISNSSQKEVVQGLAMESSICIWGGAMAAIWALWSFVNYLKAYYIN